MTDESDEITVPSSLHSQDAEAVLGIVEGHPLDETSEDLLCRSSIRLANLQTRRSYS